jgi:RimJ/RimL family protein N-acetyltransferase
MNSTKSEAPRIRLVPWAETDLDLLRAMNAPELMTHLGGPETEEQLLVRHQRYVDMSASGEEKGRMFRIEVLPVRPDGSVAAGGAPLGAGTVGFWENVWNGHPVYESGWGLLAAFQGRGIAAAAARQVVERARELRTHRHLHAFPSVDNPSSNAVCRNAGYALQGPCAFEYPPGRVMRCNDWRHDLTEAPEPPRPHVDERHRTSTDDSCL